MTVKRVSGLTAIVAITLALAVDVSAQDTAVKANAAKDRATAAAKASPELVGALSKELSSSPEQAAGAAGALFSVAKSRLTQDEFSQVSKAVPGMSALLGAAPAIGGASAGAAALSKVTGTSGSAAGLANAASAFSSLGLKPDLVAKAVPVLTSFVSKSGGADVGKLLAGALE